VPADGARALITLVAFPLRPFGWAHSLPAPATIPRVADTRDCGLDEVLAMQRKKEGDHSSRTLAQSEQPIALSPVAVGATAITCRR
jgi:hypothetical protein